MVDRHNTNRQTGRHAGVQREAMPDLQLKQVFIRNKNTVGTRSDFLCPSFTLSFLKLCNLGAFLLQEFRTRDIRDTFTFGLLRDTCRSPCNSAPQIEIPGTRILLLRLINDLFL